MSDPVVVWRKLTVRFSRSVSFPNQVPAVMEVMVFPVSEPSSPLAGATFVNPIGVQRVTLARDTEVVFDLIPSDLAGLTERLPYRIQWRQGVTGRTYTYDFAMPDQDVYFDQLHDMGQIIDGEAYLRQQDLGVPGRVARLNDDGHVVDADGAIVATEGLVATLSNALQAEVVDRQQADAQVVADAQNALEVQINALTATLSSNLNSALAPVISTANNDRATRIVAINALLTRMDLAEGHIVGLSSTQGTQDITIANKADLVDGKVPLSQIPPEARVKAVTAANQSAMLALTSEQVRRYDYCIRPDGVYVLLQGENPSVLGNWAPFDKISSVNGKTGAVTVTLSDVAATSGAIAISQVTGLSSALAATGNAEAVAELQSRLDAFESDDTVVRLVDGFIPSGLNDDHMAYVNDDGEVTDKDGNVLAASGGGGGGGPVSIGDVTGLSTALAGKVNTSDERLSDDRSPTAHAASHAAAGSDSLTLSASQITGLVTILTNNGLTSTSNHEARLQAVELYGGNSDIDAGGYDEEGGGGGGGGGGDDGGGAIGVAPKSTWYDGTDDFTEVTAAADFQTTHHVLLKGPFSIADDGKYTYSPGGIAPAGEVYVYPYITPNGHLELREWDESAPADPPMATQSALDALTTTVGTKAAQSALDTLTTTVSSKASTSALDALTTTVGTKAAQSDLEALTTTLNSKASIASLSTLETTVGTKASLADMTAAQAAISNLQTIKADLSGGTVPLGQLPSVPTSKVTGLDAALALKADLSGGVLASAQIPNVPQNKVTGLTAALALKADLDGNGKIATSQLPTLALTTVTVVANRASMLAQTTSQVQPGDVTVITATSDVGNYILSGSDPSVFSNWVKLTAPSGSVTSVNGQTGVVVLAAGDVGARSLADPLNISDITTLQTALDAKASTTALTSGLATKIGTADVQAMLVGSVSTKVVVSRVATTQVSSLSGSQSIDGALVSAGTLVLLTAQSGNPINNGCWVVQSGSWTRPADFVNGSYLLRGSIVFVTDGTTNANTIWQQTAASGVVGTANNTWTRIGYTAPPFTPIEGNGIQVSGGDTIAVKPSTGISVAGSGVAIDTGVVPRKVTGTVPSGSTTATLTHNLGTKSVIVQIIDNTDNLVLAGINANTNNTVTAEFANAPSSGQYRFIIVG